MKSASIYIRLLPLALLLASCSKFLDKIPDPTLTIPNRLEDLQALLDSYDLNNKYSASPTIMADEYYVETPVYKGVTNEIQRQLYLWQPAPENTGDWNNGYTQVIIIANTVLDYATKLPGGEKAVGLGDVKGRAYFYRGFYVYSLAQLFALPYNNEQDQVDGGIPLRLSSDFNIPSTRSSVQQTYAQIVLDLKAAAMLLPPVQTIKTRPSKAAAYGALARTYLAMLQMDSAYYYANRCIQTYGIEQLMNFNSLDSNATAPFKSFNNEVIFHCVGPTSTILANSRARIDTNLYASYTDNDLRRAIYFKKNTDKKTFQFKGDYNGSGSSTGYTFGGLVLDEILLIRAESAARLGKTQEAMDDLNLLLQSRWRNDLYVPYSMLPQEDLIRLILQERRKELLFRGTRWTDLRRLKDDSRYSVTPVRVIDGQRYELSPASARYTLKIPENVIVITGMPQNP